MCDETLHAIGDDRLSALISAQGAELHSIRAADGSAAGRELLWQAGPLWPRHAPVLFPIVGRLTDDSLLHDGVTTRMTQHGFARDRRFRFIERGARGCRLLLEDDAQSRAIYPFGFRLEIAYGIEGASLTVRKTVSNPWQSVLPASIGAHPAFIWPLDPGIAPQAHEIVFEQDEPGPVRRVEGGLLRPGPEPNPIHGRHLALQDGLFADDALILERPASTRLRYGVQDGPGLSIGWTGYRQLGLWSKPGAGFLCVEPWSGLASPLGFTGEFSTKPNLSLIGPHRSIEVAWTLTPEAIA